MLLLIQERPLFSIVETWAETFLIQADRASFVEGWTYDTPWAHWSTPGQACTSTSLYYISLLSDQHRNTNMNDKDHLVGQLTWHALDTVGSDDNRTPQLKYTLHYKDLHLGSGYECIVVRKWNLAPDTSPAVACSIFLSPCSHFSHKIS